MSCHATQLKRTESPNPSATLNLESRETRLAKHISHSSQLHAGGNDRNSSLSQATLHCCCCYFELLPRVNRVPFKGFSVKGSIRVL